MIGTISGLGLWASFLLKSGFALIGFSAYFIAVTTYFDIDMEMLVLSMSALVLITIVNILGVKKVKAIQTPGLIVTLGMLLITCAAAFFSSVSTEHVHSRQPLTPTFGRLLRHLPSCLLLMQVLRK